MNHSQEFEAHLDEVLPCAFKTALYLCRDRDDAEDLVQDAALQAFRQFDKWERGTNFKAWFLKVQHNCFLGRVRRAARRPQTVQVEDEDETSALYLFEQTRGGKAWGNDPARSFVAQLDGETIAQALRALAPEFRAVCTLFFVHQMGYEQIAQITQTPLGTVRSRLHRGRRNLQKSLWELGQERGLTENSVHGRTINKSRAPLVLALLVPLIQLAVTLGELHV